MTHSSKPIRVRMAPSPTGSLHIGGVRTALYNLLFARKQGGLLILRIEDTDEARSTKEFEQDILDSFAWVGISFDEGIMPDGSSCGAYGPYRQTERLDMYAARLQKLLEEQKAYYCFCSPEELEARRVEQETRGVVAVYSGACRVISYEDAMSRIKNGERAVIRLKVPAGKQKFADLVRGEVEFDNALIGDIVIAKSLRQPLYNFAVVIDDETMKISHVIRGEEHLANTPKQLLIAEALGIASPAYAHLAIILSATGKGKMSKRDGGTTVREYREAGYLPEAMINFLALIGWHPEGDKEVLSFDEMVKEFSLERVQKGGAKFDKAKLDYFNQQYLKRLSVTAFADILSAGHFVLPEWGREGIERVIPLVRERMTTLGDFKSLASFFFTLPEYDSAMLIWKKSSAGEPRSAAKDNLTRCIDLLRDIPAELFTQESLEAKIMKIAEQFGRGEVLWPLRVAVSGQEQSPPPIEIIAALGKTETLRRIEHALSRLNF